MPARITQPAPKGLLWLEDAAPLLGVQPSTLRKWRLKRTGPKSFKHAGRVVYRETEIDAYLDGCEAADPHSNPELNPLNRAPRPHIPGQRPGRAAA